MVESFIQSLAVVLEMFAIILVAFGGRKLHILSDSVARGSQEILMEIAVPAAILCSVRGVAFSPEVVKEIGGMMLIEAAVYVMLILLSSLIARVFHLETDDRSVLIGTATFKNIAFMGLPFSKAILGEWSVFYISFLMVVFNIFIWTYGVRMYSGGKTANLVMFLKNRALMATVPMLTLFFTGLKLPEPVWTVFDMASSMCTPLSLVLIGCMMADMQLKDVLRGHFFMLVASLMRLVAGPAITLLLVLMFKLDSRISLVLLVIATMPAATLNAVIARQYGTAGEKAAVSLMQCMLLSLLLIPLLTSLYLVLYQK